MDTASSSVSSLPHAVTAVAGTVNSTFTYDGSFDRLRRQRDRRPRARLCLVLLQQAAPDFAGRGLPELPLRHRTCAHLEGGAGGRHTLLRRVRHACRMAQQRHLVRLHQRQWRLRRHAGVRRDHARRAISTPTISARSPSSPTRPARWWSATATTPGASGASSPAPTATREPARRRAASPGRSTGQRPRSPVQQQPAPRKSTRAEPISPERTSNKASNNSSNIDGRERRKSLDLLRKI